MRPFADRADPVEGGYSKRGSEVAIRSSPRRGLFERYPKLMSERLGPLEQLGHSWRALHRRAVQTSRDFYGAPGVEWLQRPKSHIERFGVFELGHTNVNLGARVGGNHVRSGAARDHSRID